MAIFGRKKFISDIDAAPTRWSRDMLRALSLFNLLRFGLGIFLLSMIFADGLEIPLGKKDPTLFLHCTIALIVTSFIYFFLNDSSRRSFKLVTFLQFLTDVIIITLIIHANGGLIPSLTTLLIITICSGCVILRLVYGFSLAITGITLLWVEHLYSVIKESTASDYQNLIFTSSAILATSAIICILARRAREAEAQSDEHEENILALSSVNNALIQDLEIGIIVIDDSGLIETNNPAAFRLLGKEYSQEAVRIDKVHKELSHKHRLWVADKTTSLVLLHNEETGDALNAEFERFGRDNYFTKITIHSRADLQEKAHQMTLAAMGRMATGIAHEVRNPLTTISAANELLGSQKYTSKSEKKAIHMINTNCERINTIIEEVLTIGRSGNADVEEIKLREWLKSFLFNYCAYSSHPVESMKLFCEDIVIRFSKQHLHQVMANLCDNAYRYSEPTVENPLKIIAKNLKGIDVINVISPGEKIATDVTEKLFEPFFSTGKDRGGTGLGLYICQEICTLNLAKLSYVETKSAGNCFRITLSNKSGANITHSQTMTRETTSQETV